MTRQKFNRSNSQHNESSTKKNENGKSGMNSLDEETELLRRKLDAEKARKRTRGPYRKSHVN